MVAAVDARTVEDGTASRVFVQNLTFENAPVFECEMKDVPLRRIRHRIEFHHSRHAIQGLQPVTHAPKIAVTTVQTPDSSERLTLRHLLHTGDTWMQRLHPRSGTYRLLRSLSDPCEIHRRTHTGGDAAAP
jgi:hypothetical protein